MTVEIIKNSDSIAAVIKGDIDHHGAGALRRQLDAAIERHSPSLLVLDFGGVQFMDSSGIGLIMGRYKLMQSIGGRLEIISVLPGLRKIMDMSGLTRLISIH